MKGEYYLCHSEISSFNLIHTDFHVQTKFIEKMYLKNYSVWCLTSMILNVIFIHDLLSEIYFESVRESAVSVLV